MFVIMILAAVGFIVSVYGFVIEQKIKKNAQYKPVCDISDAMSCVKPIISPYGKIFFGIPNTILGMLFYTTIFVLALLQAKMVIFLSAIAACIVSVILAWILYVKIKTVCVLCSTIYVINILLLIVSYYNL